MRRPRSRTGLCPSKVKLTSSTPWRCAAAPQAASVPVAPPLKRMQSSRFTPPPPEGRSLRLRARGQTGALPADDAAVVVTRRSWDAEGAGDLAPVCLDPCGAAASGGATTADGE